MTLDEGLEQARVDATTERDRTDAKASALLTALGIPLAVLVTAVPGHRLSPAAAVLTGLGAAGLLAAMVTVLLVIKPRLGLSPRGSFLHWADCTPEQLVDDLTVDRRAERVITLSRISRTKFRALAWSVGITITALGLLAAAVITSLA